MDKLLDKSLAHHEGILSSLRGIMLRESDIHALSQTTCEILASSLNYCAVWLALVEEHDRRAQIIGLAGDRPDLQKIILPQDDLVEPIAACGGPVAIASRTISDDEDGEFHFEHASIPLCHEGQIIGELHACLDSQRKYPDDELRLLESVAIDAAAGIIRLQLDHQRGRLVREVESLRDLSVEMISGREINTLFQTLVEQVTTLLGGTSGALYICDPEKRQVLCVVSHLTEQDYTGTVLPYGEGAAGVVAQTGEALIIPNYARWEHRSKKFSTSAFHAVMSVPLRWQGEITGVIHVLRDQGGAPFTQADCELLTLYANQAAVVLENARLLEDIKKRVLQLDQLTDLNRAAMIAGDLEELLIEFSRHLMNMLGADQSLFFRWNTLQDAPALLEGSDSLGASGDPSQIPVDDLDIIRAALVEGLPLVAQSAHGQPTFPTWLAETWKAKTLLAAPIIEGKIWQGVALLIFEDEVLIRHDEIELVEQASAQVALTVAKMGVLEAERKRTRTLEALRKASLSLTSKLEVSAVLESILSNALELVAADDAHIFLFENNELSFGAAKWADGTQNVPFALPRPQGITNSVARSGKAIVVKIGRAHV